MTESPTYITEPTPFKVYAIRYATVARRSVENYLGADPHEAGERMDYFVWLARNEQHTIVIDTGFNEVIAAKRRREFLRSPVVGLKMLGVDAGTVKDVIITHLHHDHVGNYDLFPQARFHIQDREMSYVTGRYMGIDHFARPFEVEEVIGMVRHVFAKRVDFHDGDEEIVPGLSVHHVGGHTPGLQIVRVWTQLGWLVLASDASHYYGNMNDQRPFPIVTNILEMADGWQKARRLASQPRYIIPGHDPLVMERYQAPAANLEGIVVRLDAEPVGTD